MATVTLVGLIAGGHSGVPRYAVKLAQGIDRVSAELPELEVTLLTGERGAEEVAPRHLRVALPPRRLAAVSSGASRVLLEQLMARTSESDLLHFLDLSGPVLAPGRAFTTTIHDAAVARGYGPRSYAYKRRLAPWSLRHARAAIAVSAFARDEAVRLFGGDPRRIHVVHSGPGLLPEGKANAESARRPLLLYVGNLGANKNLPFLVSAFAAADVEGELVIAGRATGPSDTLRRAITESPASGRIRVLTDVGDEGLDTLYRTASALAAPSRYEGFGFPPLEAMARGCPVLASDIPAFREVSGDGALLLPVDDRDAWARAIRRVLTEEELRRELRARGAATAGRYSWDTTAREVCRLLVEAAQAAGS